jgi:rhodanese-related sulfurtransferase/rubrerythrin
MYEENGFYTVSADELKKYIADKRESEYALIDVRQPQEYAAGHLPGARLLPLPELERALPGLAATPGQVLVFYCAGGRRSRMAARLALQAKATGARVLNLEHGFGGWSGMALPGAPKLELFGAALADADQPELLLKAMDLEKAAEKLYLAIRAAASNRIVCELMDQLAPMERAHAALAYKQLGQVWDESARGPLQPFDALYAALEGKVVEGGGELDSLAPWIEQAKSGACLELAELGLEIETAAYDLYRNAADRFQDPAVRRIFLGLAEQEKAHARLFLDKLDAFLERA